MMAAFGGLLPAHPTGMGGKRDSAIRPGR